MTRAEMCTVSSARLEVPYPMKELFSRSWNTEYAGPLAASRRVARSWKYGTVCGPSPRPPMATMAFGASRAPLS